MGRSCGGLTTKLHVVDRRSRLLKMLITAGQFGDAPQAEHLQEELQLRTDQRVIVDAAYDINAIRQRVKQLRARASIRLNPSRQQIKKYHSGRYKLRNVIKRLFGGIKRYRRISSRYEKKATNFAGYVWLAAFLASYF